MGKLDKKKLCTQRPKLNGRNVEELKSKAICSDCIFEPYLSDVITAEGDDRECSYCGDAGVAVDLDTLADKVELAFTHHFIRTSDEPDFFQYLMQKDKESDYQWSREGQETAYAIMDAAQISETAAFDVQAILEERHDDFDASAAGIETEFSTDARYEEIMPGDDAWYEEWRNFEKLIKTEARFFSRTAASYLGRLFDHIDEMQTKDGKPLVVDAGPDSKITHLYRARVFQSDDPLKAAMKRPDKELAAPPSHVAGAGRMNAKGISVFYGATKRKIALAEVRSPVGSQVLVARFEITRPLKLLDLSALGNVREIGSIFDPGFANRLGRMMFLSTLSDLMARPVMPDDQDTEYLPTQAIADYLATEGKVPLDGILFPSVQVGGKGRNVVLFHKASRCAEMEFPDGTEIHAETYSSYAEGPEIDYTVTEEVPLATEDTKEKTKIAPFSFGDDWPGEDDLAPRNVALRIEPESLRVHRIRAVKIKSKSFEVRRRRWEKGDADF